MTNRALLLILLPFFISSSGKAQIVEQQEKEVMDVVFQLFEGMRMADTSMIKSSFVSHPKMYTATKNQQAQPVLAEGSLKDFLQSVSKMQPNMMNEPIWDYKVQIDNDLAAVWTKYAFYFNNRFSHCGVDAFHLHRTNEGWKIFQLVDTRQREGCQVPDDIKVKFENK
ncbi:MAG TPA: nuclear transport factor 2 family protein [Cyclobacteriaceae bacterium]|nr:nuclear transport factor 2 family protein [Cyclobacteriaceae bacterium]